MPLLATCHLEINHRQRILTDDQPVYPMQLTLGIYYLYLPQALNPPLKPRPHLGKGEGGPERAEKVFLYIPALPIYAMEGEGPENGPLDILSAGAVIQEEKGAVDELSPLG